MATRIVVALALVVGLSAFASPLLAGDPTFPVGLWVADSFGSQRGLKPEWLAALRWQGMNVGTAGNSNSMIISQNKLARYDSVGHRIWLVAGPFHSSDPPHGIRNLDITSRDQRFTGADSEYFISNNYIDPTPLIYFSRSSFDTYLNNKVSSVVDSVKNYHALWKYFYWDEPNGHLFVGNPPRYTLSWARYWNQIWWMADSTVYPTFARADSLGTHSWLKWKIEHRDSLHSVLLNVAATPSLSSFFNATATLCTTKYRSPQDTVYPNKMQGVTYDVWPFFPHVPIGDSTRLYWAWTSWADTAVAAAKKASPSDPIPVYVTQLQHCGILQPITQHIVTDSERITTPEEIRELANLAILHEIKGIFYFLLPSNTLGYGNIQWAEFWDEDFVPFNAPYKDYVYNRYHSGYASPDSLIPFCPDSTVHDPFRSLGPNPGYGTYPKGKENYYKWKYAPYARNWDSLKTLNDELHIIAPHLRYIWKVGQRITRVVPDYQGPPGPPLPEYVTFSDSIYTSSPTYYAFLVSKDFSHTQWGDSVIVNLPTPPQGQTYYVLDLNSRHLIPSTGRIKFHTVLKSGEGRLFKFVLAGNPQGGGAGPLQAGYVPNPYNGSMWNTLLVTDPDLSFQKYPTGGFPPNVQFTEGDTVVLSATVYNLGFADQTDSVKFYLGDPLAGGTFLGGSSVTVPALSTSDTLQKTVTATYNWVTNGSTPLGPYDINFILKGATSSAHSLLWLNAQDYATTVNQSPWDMNETKLYPDISSSPGFSNLTDSISSCWEGTTNIPTTPTLHFRLAKSIDASKYKMLTFKIFSHQADSVTVRYSPQQPGGTPGWTLLLAYQWQVVTVNLGVLSSWGGSVTDFYLQFPTTANRKIRLAWAKLTTR